MKYFGFGVVLGLMLILGGVACSPKEVPCKYRVGQFVRSVLDDTRGQIISRYSTHCTYWIRFATPIETQKHSWDVEKVPYATISMYEYELKADE